MSEGERAGPTWRPAWWPFGRGRSEPSSVVPAPPVAVSLPVAPEGAWRDLPAVQRTLSDPLRPVAIGDEFRQSLASFTDPSFVAPLSHLVDPSTGGLVDGLASPGRPYAHPGVADLPVPARPAAPAAPRVQRSVAAWSGSADLPTVSWELPGAAADEAESPVPVAPPLTGDQVEPTVAASVPAGLGPVSAPAPITAQRSLAAVPTRPGPTGLRPAVVLGGLPVVAGSAVSTAPARSGLPEAPVVSRVPDAAAESAPLSGFAAAITSLAGADEEPAGPEDGPASASDGDDRPVAGSPLQRLAADAAPRPAAAPEPAAGASDVSLSGLPVLSTVDQRTRIVSSSGSSMVGSLPVVARVLSPAGEGPPSPPIGDRGPSLTGAAPPADRPVDAPTLGPRLAQAPLAVPGAPLIARLASSGEPAVQRVEFLTPPVGTVRPTPPAGAPVSEAAPVAFPRPRTETADRPSPTSFSSPLSTPLPAAPQVQRVWEPAVPATVVRRPAADAGSDTAWVEEPSFATVTDLPSSPVDRIDRSEPTGPAVAAEPWTPIPSISVAVPPGPAAALAAASPTAAAYTAQRVASSPMVTVGPSIPVQRSAAHANEAAAETPSTAAPMVVSRQAAGALPPGAARSGGAVSFASMFGSAGAMPTVDSGAAADGFSSVQREPDDAAPTASEPAGEPAASAPISSAAPPPAGAAPAPTDLDEMARRLYEPLSARLRAEFWLDRERAGVVSDV